MAMRRNAGLGMARIVNLVNEIAWTHAPNAVGAVGQADLYPNSRNVIAGRAVFTVDFRSPDVQILADMERQLEAGARDICDGLSLGLDMERIGGFEPVSLDPACVSRVREAAARLGYSHRDIVSGAGHDACWIARVAPAAMVMCPCVGGLSHNEAENILPQWATAGAEVLLHAVIDTAEVVSRRDRLKCNED